MSNMAAEPTHIAAHTYIKGELHLAGPTVIGGRVEGAVTAQDTVEISPDGLVEGDVHGVLVDIQGTVKGNISASHACRLGPTARVSGELRAANLAIAEGASFVGQVYVGEPAAMESEESQRDTRPEQATLSSPVSVAHSSIAAPTPPPLAPATINTINRIDALTEQVDVLAASVTTAAPSGPAVRIVSQTVQHAVSRGPKIIKAR